ncbi:MAG: class I SAM-dependent methyltransferase [Promethearchaeota archaeon]
MTSKTSPSFEKINVSRLSISASPFESRNPFQYAVRRIVYDKPSFSVPVKMETERFDLRDMDAERWNEAWLNDQEDVDLLARNIREQPLNHPLVDHIIRAYPDLSKLRVCEVGAGIGRFSMALALRGAEVVLLDISQVALDRAVRLASALGVTVTCHLEDIFSLPTFLEGQFDVAASFGLIEHFDGKLRRESVRAHARLLRPGGIMGIHVPNALCPFYRLWKFIAEQMGFWSVGFEKPFTRRELRALCTGFPMKDVQISGADFSYAVNNFFLGKLYWGLRNLLIHGSLRGKGDPYEIPSWFRIPKIGWPFSEYLGYSLTIIAKRL